MNSTTALDQILVTLKNELALLTRAAQDAFAAATDPDSKAENKYDTRTLESSYIARGQSKRVEELHAAVQAFETLRAHEPAGSGAVALGSLFCLETAEGRSHYFMGPFAGGTEITLEGQEVVVITPSSPLAQKLMGRKSGALITLSAGVAAELRCL